MSDEYLCHLTFIFFKNFIFLEMVSNTMMSLSIFLKIRQRYNET